MLDVSLQLSSLIHILVDIYFTYEYYYLLAAAVFPGVMTVEGEELAITKVSREHMGAYLCIAKNMVPPPVSKRILLNVHCKSHDLDVVTIHCFIIEYKQFK